MMAESASEALARVVRGHGLLLACAVLYLVWWAVFFRPDAGRVTGALYGFGAACLVGAAVCGLVGVFVAASALGSLPGASRVSGWAFALGGVVGYLVLLALTAGVFRRQVTTELLLIDAWGAFELCVVATLSASGAVGGDQTEALFVLVGVLVAASLVCYVLYYRLGPVVSFVDGAVPLVAVGVESAVLMAVVAA